jgi:polar amino acid transport system substrate-binding protein
MLCPPFRKRERREMSRNRLILAITGVVATVAAASAIASSTSTITPPANIKAAGKIVFCNDISYPPEEYFVGSKAVGSDVDIAASVARLMGVKSVQKNTPFDSIIPALLSKKCDAIIAGMNDTPERRKQVNFVDYLKVGQSLAVPKGNPLHITTLASLSGRRVSVETGTTNRDFLAAESKKLVKQGKKPITIVSFPKDTDAFAAILAGRVDAYYADAPPAAYYVKKYSSKLEIGGNPINPFPIGIAIRKNDPLRGAVAKGIAILYKTGAMKRIVAKWGMTNAVVLLKK